jgi:hypothetical protein
MIQITNQGGNTMSLETCSSGHEEIVYSEGYRSGRRSKCPLCEANSKIEELETSVAEYEVNVQELRDEISALEGDG